MCMNRVRSGAVKTLRHCSKKNFFSNENNCMHKPDNQVPCPYRVETSPHPGYAPCFSMPLDRQVTLDGRALSFYMVSSDLFAVAKTNQTSAGPKEIQVVVIGGGGVGKSALTVQFIQGHFIDEYDPTIEDSYRKDCTVDGTSLSLDILDTAGQEEYSAMREQYMRTGMAFLLVYAVTSRSSFEETQMFYQQILRTKNVDSFPVVLVGNKCDLGYERQVSYEEVQRLAQRLGAPFLETSAKDRINVDEAFYTLAKSVLKYQQAQAQARPVSHSAPARTNAKTPARQNQEKDSGCRCVVC